jgi:hypothetical protein
MGHLMAIQKVCGDEYLCEHFDTLSNVVAHERHLRCLQIAEWTIKHRTLTQQNCFSIVIE